MPILRNDSTSTKPVRDKNGLTQILQPGESITTYYFSADPEITVVNIEPLLTHNIGTAELDFTSAIPVAYQSDVGGFTGAKIDISLDSDVIWMQIESGEVTIYRQHPDQDPELIEWTDTLPVLPLTAKGTLTKLYVSGTGQVKIVQWRREL